MGKLDKLSGKLVNHKHKGSDLVDGTITTAKIVDEAITDAKLSTDLQAKVIDTTVLKQDTINKRIGVGGVTTPLSTIHAKGDNSVATIDTVDKMVADGTFNTNTGWTVRSGWTITEGKATHTSGTASLTGTTNMDAGNVFVAYVTISGRTTGSVNVLFGTYNTGKYLNSDAVHIVYGLCSPTTPISFVPTTDFNGSIELVELFKINESTPELILEASNGTVSVVDIRNGADFYNIGIGKSSLSCIIPDLNSPFWGLNNIGLGDRALRSVINGKYNVAIGQESMLKLTTGYNNTGVGDSTLNFCATGYNNTAVGYETLGRCISGFENTAVGANAGYSLSTANHNVFIGSLAGYSDLTGNSNIAIGRNALFATTAGAFNLAIGQNALQNSTNSYNIAMGVGSVTQLTTGQSNIAIGYNAGTGETTTNAPTTDDFGILIGWNANRSVASATKLVNYLAIGKQALVDKSNQFVYGNSNVVEHLFRSGKIVARGLSVYNDNTSAKAGGLEENDFYKTSTGELRIVV